MSILKYKMSSHNLSSALKDWTEIDVSAFYVGVALGIIPPASEEQKYSFSGYKWMFWTDNPLGNMLFDTLENLVNLKILEKHSNDELYRWNPDFDLNNLK